MRRTQGRSWLAVVCIRSTSAAVIAALLASACSDGAGGEAGPLAGPAKVTASVQGSPEPTGSPPELADLGTLRISDSGCTLDLVEGPISAGPAYFIAVNETDGPVAFNVARIAEGFTYRDLVAHIRKEIRLAEADELGLGIPDFAVPEFGIDLDGGESDRMIGIVNPGVWGLVCFRDYGSGELRPAGALGPVVVE